MLSGSTAWVNRLLRNRVSAQQARERKKCYVSNLEGQAKKSEQMVRALVWVQSWE